MEIVVDAVVIADHERIVTLYLILVTVWSTSNAWTHMVNIGISKRVVDLFDGVVLVRAKSRLRRSWWKLQVLQKLRMHFFEDPHALLMPVVDLGEQREIICSILIEYVVLDYNHLQFLHVESCIHLNCTLVYKINDLGLSAQLRVL